MTTPELITLRHEATRVQICPVAGGGIVRFWHDDGVRLRDWLRPVRQETIHPQRGGDMGSYPLVPYCNRIRVGRFSFQGQQVQLPLNAEPQPHSLHGHGWQAEWQVVTVSTGQLTLEYQHQADAWPWPYRVRQTFSVGRQRLQIELQLENLSDSAMPAGLGLHPFFIRTPRSRVYAEIDQIWLTDAEVMPLELVAPEPARDPRRGIRVNQVRLDNNYTGWRGLARIQWPEWQAEMTILAEPPLDHLVLFTPADKPVVCVEPVSNVTDAVNLTTRSDTGLHSLEPGQMLSASACFHYAFIAEDSK